MVKALDLSSNGRIVRVGSNPTPGILLFFFFFFFFFFLFFFATFLFLFLYSLLHFKELVHFVRQLGQAF